MQNRFYQVVLYKVCMNGTVVLLKKESASEDEYRSLITNSTSYNPCFIPVLDHTLSNLDLLKSKLLQVLEQPDQYDIIITSQRAVDALYHCASRDLDQSNWGKIAAHTQFYTVGHSTAGALAKLGILKIQGQDSGSGSALSKIIIEQERLACARRILFIAGAKRRDAIPDGLVQNGIPFEEITVYETKELPSFKDALEQCMERGDVRWLVLFSPAGAQIMNPLLNTAVRIATIGPTTAQYFERECGRAPDAVAIQPSAEGLVAAILAAQ